jgi:hypothetical protein
MMYIPSLPQAPLEVTIKQPGGAGAVESPTSILGDCLRHRSGVAARLSRFASQAKPLLTIAEHALTLAIILACLALPAIFAGA